jgi:hypothetical protein
MRRADADQGEGEAERCLSEKVSILISAYGSTERRELLLSGCDCVLSVFLHIPSRKLV